MVEVAVLKLLKLQ